MPPLKGEVARSAGGVFLKRVSGGGVHMKDKLKW